MAEMKVNSSLMLCCGCLVCWLAMVPAAVADRHVTIDASGVVEASKKPDIDKIEALNNHFRTRDYAGLFSSAFSYMNFDFEKSRTQAQSCYRKEDDGSITYISAHLICGEMMARAYYLDAKYAKWANLMLRYKKEIVPQIWQRVPQTNGIPVDIIDDIKYSDFVDWPSVRVGAIPGSSHIVDMTWDMIDNTRGADDKKVPVINIKINGVPVDAIVDTGASLTVVPFGMSRYFGLHHISILEDGYKSAYNNHLRASLARVDTLDIAGFRFSNAMISVADVSRPVIGLLQLIKLHRIRLDKNHFQVIYQSSGREECAKRMYFGGVMSGFPSRVKMTAKINGHIEHPVLDTGFGGTFRKIVHHMRNGLGEEFWGYDTKGMNKLVGHWTYATINANGSDNRVRGSIIYFKKRQAGYRFGAQLINEIGPLYLDFDSGYACFQAER
ncbi:MAG TPA: retropepsin-like aspartic protease [Oleiagrimonas sp.]|nr:retropepsin-like aspartic protease [Oleiagrimonas sp.]